MTSTVLLKAFLGEGKYTMYSFDHTPGEYECDKLASRRLTDDLVLIVEHYSTGVFPFIV